MSSLFSCNAPQGASCSVPSPQRLEKCGRWERAIVCYQEAIADDPSLEAIKTRVVSLRKVVERKVGNNWSGCCVLETPYRSLFDSFFPLPFFLPHTMHTYGEHCARHARTHTHTCTCTCILPCLLRLLRSWRGRRKRQKRRPD